MSDIAIVGGGIAGLTAALALVRRGVSVQVIEQASALREIGAGLQISPNGWAVLRGLGLDDRVEGISLASQAVVLADGLSGREVVRMPLDARPFRLVARPDLIAMLGRAAEAAGVRLRLGTRVEAVRDGGTLKIDGRDEVAGFVLGADGLHSKVRPLLNGRETPFFTGQVAWRAMVPGHRAEEARVDMAPGRHVVRYPLTGNRVNLVAVEERAEWTEADWRQQGDPREMRRTFAGLPDVAVDLDRVETCHVWGLFRHEVARSWVGEHSALIGDAAHPTLPFLAQGANLALEDGWSFAAAYVSGNLPAWAAYRRDRCARAIAAADANARNYHLRGPARVAAHAALRVAGLAPGAMLRRFDWLYGHDVTGGA